MATFVKIIEFRTCHMDRMDELIDAWVERTEGRRTAFRSVVGQNRSDSVHYVEIVEFPSGEEAKYNMELSGTNGIHEEMLALCEEPPRILDLDVVRDTRF